MRNVLTRGCGARRSRRPARGQALVLFALSVGVLLMLAGISIDGLRVSIAFAQAQRAAEAAALASAPYLPQYLTSATPAPDGNDATDRARQEAAKDGFTDPSAITVTMSMDPVPEVHVAIHISVPLSLLAMVGIAPAGNVAGASAMVVPPVALGDGSNAFADWPEHLTDQIATIGSANEMKERGDPFTPFCEDGWSEASDTSHQDATTPIYTSRLGTPTNVPQYSSGPQCSPGTPGNPNQIPAGFGGLATRTTPVPTGESYLITIPAGLSGFAVWVWNPRFVWSGAGDPSSLLFPTESLYSGGYTDNPAFYPQIAYSLFSVPEIYNRANDVPLAALWGGSSPPDTSPDAPLPPAQIVAIPPLDTYGPDLAVHGCSAGDAWDLSGGSTYSGTIVSGQGCVSLPDDVGEWVALPIALSSPVSAPTYYRLTVDTGNGYGLHSYAVKVCQNLTDAVGCATGGAAIAAWNSATVSLLGNAKSETYPLADIGPEYAGRSVQLALFNPGLGAGNATLAIVPPAAGGSVDYPAYLRTVVVSGSTVIQTSVSGDDLYHGKWVRLTLTLPPDYSGGEWQLTYTSDTAPPDTTMTVAAQLVGTPIQLLSTS
jgi:hypothetical protein